MVAFAIIAPSSVISMSLSRPWCLAGLLGPWLPLLATPLALAQVTPDATLGAEGSLVAPGGVVRGAVADLIEGGAVRGGNLFHSFLEFNVDTGQRVYFDSPAGINHIFSRVTGNNLSQIDGVLGMLGSSADLFFMNPNGVVFGPTASLDVQGSLIITTANAIGFGETGLFSASEPTADQLLTINPSAFLFTTLERPATIMREASTSSGVVPTRPLGLRVPVGANIILLGGDIQIEGFGPNDYGSAITAPNGRIELAAIAEQGTVGFDASQYALMLPADLARADITLNNNINIYNGGLNITQDGGDIALYTNNLTVSGASKIATGVTRLPSTRSSQVGSILIDGTGIITFDNSEVEILAQGYGSTRNFNVGSITIRGQEIYLINGSRIGLVGDIRDAGNVTLEAERYISLSGRDPNFDRPSSIYAAPGSFISNDPVNGGDIILTAPQIELHDGALVVSQIFSPAGGSAGIQINVTDLSLFDGSQVQSDKGSGRTIAVQAQGQVTLDGTNASGNQPSGLTSNDRSSGVKSPDGSDINLTSIGNGGDINVTARTLTLRNGAFINAGTSLTGNTGNIFINTQELLRVEGGQRPSGIAAEVNAGASGNGQLVQIDAGTLELLNGGLITSSTFGQGTAGNIEINIRGNALLQGTTDNELSQSGLFSIVGSTAEGNGGTIHFSTANLSVLDGAVINASTFGTGDAGNVVIEVGDRAAFDGTSADRQFASAVSSIVAPGAEGTGGNVVIRTGALDVTNGAQLSTSTFGTGDAGNVVINVSGQMRVSNGSISSFALETSGGSIDIRAGHLILRENSNILTLVGLGEGSGGNITIIADFVIALDDSNILAFSADGQGGDIDLSRTTFFRQNANIASGQLSRAELFALVGNDRVDVNASGGVESGQITVGDSSFIENSLTNLEDTITDTAALTAGSCIARTDESLGSFAITGSGGLPQRPDDTSISNYPTGTVRTIAEPIASLQEPDNVYQLPDGRLVLSHTCE